MDKIRARTILTRMWIIVFEARTRRLTEDEVAWLGELCREIRGGVHDSTSTPLVRGICSSIATLQQMVKPNDDYCIDLLLKLSELRELLNQR